jgi:hypothetical protein
MTLALRLGRGETPGWIYSPATPGFFFTGGYCCKVASKRFLLFGGNQLGGIAMRSVIAFDGSAWTSRTHMPGIGRFDSGSAVVNDTVVCVAGYDVEPSASCVRYSPFSDHWSTIDQITGPRRYAHATTAVGQKVLVFCGRDILHNNLTKSAIFEAEVWMSASDAPLPARARASATSVNGRAFLTGGSAEVSTPLSDHLEFVIQAGSWIQKTSLPLPGRQGHAAFTAMLENVITGGGTPLQTSTFIHNPISDTWRSALPLTLPARQWAGAGPGIRADSGFVSGGETDSGIRLLNHNEFTSGTWITQTSLPAPARKQLTGATV